MLKKSLGVVLLFAALLSAAWLTGNGQAARLLRPGNPLVSPLANANNADPDAHVKITYDEAIDPATVTPQTFFLHGYQTGLLWGTLSVYSGTIDLLPSQSFHPGELVQVVATTQTLSIVDGLGPLQPTVWHYRVGVESGTGYFGSTGQVLDDGFGQDVELGDLDGDGDLDAFVANCLNSYVWRNIGSSTARFERIDQAVGPSDCSVNVSLGDLDGDGDLDVVNVTTSLIRVWFNNGLGGFTSSGQVFGEASGTSAELGDLDGDGDLDIFYTVRSASSNQVLLNDGLGYFVPHSDTGDSDKSTAVALGDLDGDGDLDAWVSVSGGVSTGHRVYKNDGQAVFTVWQTIIVNPPNPANSVSLGDLDGDGDLDAFLAVITLNNASGSNQIWLNDGLGTFTDSGQRLGEKSTNQIVLGDLDGDGDLDAVTINIDKPNEVWLNQGGGSYVFRPQRFAYVNILHAALGDLNADGSLDLFMVRTNEPDWVMINQGEYYPLYLPNISK